MRTAWTCGDARRVVGFLLTPAYSTFDLLLGYTAIDMATLTSVLYCVGPVCVRRKSKVDAQLLAGAVVFGIGWGMESICRKYPSPVP